MKRSKCMFEASFLQRVRVRSIRPAPEHPLARSATAAHAFRTFLARSLKTSSSRRELHMFGDANSKANKPTSSNGMQSDLAAPVSFSPDASAASPST